MSRPRISVLRCAAIGRSSAACSRCNKVGAAGLIGNAILARINNHAALETEQRRGQSTLIVEAMKTGKPEDACRNLVFFVNLKLIDEPTGAIKGCAADPRGAPVLPSQGVQQAVGIHGHSESDQARRKKARKAARQGTAPIRCSSESCKSLRPLRGARSCRGEEACFIGCW